MIKTRIYTDGGASFVVSLDPNLKITKNITLKEIANNQAKDEIKMVFMPDTWTFNRMLQLFRERASRAKGSNVPINFIGEYRTPSFNASCGGDKNSLHLKPYAADIDNASFLTVWNETMARNEWRTICEQFGFIGGFNSYRNKPRTWHLSIHEEQFGHKEFVNRRNM